MLAGSNPNQTPVIPPATDPQGFHTEFRVEIHTPRYLSRGQAARRPKDVHLSTLSLETVSTEGFNLTFACLSDAQNVAIALYHGGFVTHALHMGQRMLFLDVRGFRPGSTKQDVTVRGPPSKNVAPPGPYVVYVVVDGVPSVGQVVMVG